MPSEVHQRVYKPSNELRDPERIIEFTKICLRLLAFFVAKEVNHKGHLHIMRKMWSSWNGADCT